MQADQPGPVLEVRGLRTVFDGRGGRETVAVDDASFDVAPGQCLAVVGESGSGKSTLARSVLRLVEPTAGRVRYRGTDLTALDRRALRPYRRHLQMIFQDPYASLHPRQSVLRLVSEPWRIHRDLMPEDPCARVAELLEQVGMPPAVIDMHPTQLSGGQRQRVAIARALGLEPDVLVLDEPVSALDVSIQAQVIALLMELQQSLGLTYLFISHDLALVRLVASEVIVMHHGVFVETGTTERVFEDPRDEYTRSLLAASPHL
ncbi:ATP-binding cassette domain-containing protein [Phycicoccus avicenniae]|uniref:ATP-binding cassette domain-containing protein n=1 Tax=Phycicoccus avicenniae TaxID=2828860 RepID=UPI002012A8A8|nr:ATP-binding cassette domain-containing protein [Phycicoccus avicenniae]